MPVMSAKVRTLGLPCSTAVRANGFVFISATPPVDMVTGEMARGDIDDAEISYAPYAKYSCSGRTSRFPARSAAIASATAAAPDSVV